VLCCSDIRLITCTLCCFYLCLVCWQHNLCSSWLVHISETETSASCCNWTTHVAYSCGTDFTARCYASAVLAMGLCLSVSLCLSVCMSQVGVLLKRLKIRSRKQHHTIAQGLQFYGAKDLREIRPGSPPTRAPNAGGVGQNRITGFISKTVQDRHILPIKVE